MATCNTPLRPDAILSVHLLSSDKRMCHVRTAATLSLHFCCWLLPSSPSPPSFVDFYFHHPPGLITNDGTVVVAANGIVVGATATEDNYVVANKGVELLSLLLCSCCHCHPPLSPLHCHPTTHIVVFLFVGCHLFLHQFVWLNALPPPLLPRCRQATAAGALPPMPLSMPCHQ